MLVSMKPPLPAKLLTGVILLDIAAFIWAVNGGEKPTSMMDEGDMFTFLSALQLLAAGLVSLAVFRFRNRQSGPWRWRSSYTIWALMGVGFIFLAIDEISQFHENLDRWIHHGLGIAETLWTDMLDDLIVALYGLIGLAGIGYYRREFPPYKGALKLLIPGFILLFAMVGLDIATLKTEAGETLISRSGDAKYMVYWIMALEEGFKVLASGVFIGAFYYCWYITRHDGNKTAS